MKMTNYNVHRKIFFINDTLIKFYKGKINNIFFLSENPYNVKLNFIFPQKGNALDGLLLGKI